MTVDKVSVGRANDDTITITTRGNYTSEKHRIDMEESAARYLFNRLGKALQTAGRNGE